MNIKTKLLFGIGILAGMIILLVTLSVVNLQILTATEPDSPVAMPALERALLWISVTGGICILTLHIEYIQCFIIDKKNFPFGI